SLMMPRGVAVVNASTSLSLDAGQEVIWTGNDMSINTLPTRAGLKMLLPNPPNESLPMPTAARAPIMMIHHGKFEGTLKAKRIPVINAEPSETIGLVFIRYF